MANKKNSRIKIKNKTVIDISKKLIIAGMVFLIFVLGKEVGVGGKLLSQYKNLFYGLSAAALVMAFFAAFVSYFEYHGIGPQDGIIRRGSRHLNVVSITFDDGPSPLYTPKILDILKEKKVKATFFLTGKHVEKYPDVARRILAEGHEIGNHTYSHKEMFALTKKIADREIGKAEQAIIDILGVRPTLFRPPRGIYSNTIRALLVKKGYDIVLWTISSVDWRNIPSSRITARIQRFVHNGAIILFHDSGALIKREGGKRVNTVKALPEVIDMLRNNNYKMVTVGTLIELAQEDQSLTFVSEEV